MTQGNKSGDGNEEDEDMETEEEVPEEARKLRNYWNKYGKMDFPTRMMTILSDPDSNGTLTLKRLTNCRAKSLLFLRLHRI